MTALHVIMACFLLHYMNEGVASAHPWHLRICARLPRAMAGDRLQGIKSPWRGLYMYSQLVSCRIQRGRCVIHHDRRLECQSYCACIVGLGSIFHK